MLAACQTSRCSVGQTCQAGVCGSGAPKCGIAGDSCKTLFSCSESIGACDYRANKDQRPALVVMREMVLSWVALRRT